MSQRLSPEDLTRAIDCALDLAEAGQWGSVTLSDIAIESQLPLSALTATVRTKLGLLSAYLKQVDTETVTNADPETADVPVRDRLFDLILCRFDALEARKKAVGRIMRDALNDPVEAITGAAMLGRSLATLLEAAGVSTSGLGGFARVQGLGAVYLRTFQVWLTDDSPDMSATMAELDKRLNQAESVIQWIEARRSPPRAPLRLLSENLGTEAGSEVSHETGSSPSAASTGGTLH